MQYNEILRQLREDKDYTQTEIAKILNVSQITYSQYERGVRGLPLEHLKTLCLFYGISSDYILGIPNNLIYPKERWKPIETLAILNNVIKDNMFSGGIKTFAEIAIPTAIIILILFLKKSTH